MAEIEFGEIPMKMFLADMLIDTVDAAFEAPASPSGLPMSRSYGQDFNQDKDANLAAGQQVYCKIVSLRSWEEGGDVTVFDRDTFYVWLMAPQVAQAAIAHNRGSI